MSPTQIGEKHLNVFGFIISLQTAPRYKLMRFNPWCLDNDEFNKKFDICVWLRRLRQCKDFVDTCVFVLAPDVVGNYQATLARFPKYSKIVRKFGYPVALATQDGLTSDKTPWSDFDVLFVGGTDRHKLGPEAGDLINEAIKRNKWVHIGRVNSPSRMYQFWRADSWDGTHIIFEPDVNIPKIARVVQEIRAMKAQPKIWEDL